MTARAPYPATAGSTLIDICNIDVEFGPLRVLRELSLGIPRGQTVVIIGESGCGKTVLLKTMIGLVRPTRGQVNFEGRNLATLSEHELTGQRTRYGFVFQQAALFDSLTVGQNVAFPLRQHTDYGSQQIRDIVVDKLAQVGLPESVLWQTPAQLSGGMRKRVGLARALALDPELILYDEPTTGLDPIMSDVINELIMSTRRDDRVTSVVVTHDMSTARKVADRLIMVYPVSRLEPGEPQIIFDGTAHELDQTSDQRVIQFTQGRAGERLMELRQKDRVAGTVAANLF